jgi:minor extracellular protease Epr
MVVSRERIGDVMSKKKQRYVIVPDDNVFNDTMETTSFKVFKNMHRQLYGTADASFRMAAFSHGTEAGIVPPTRPNARFMETEAGRLQLLDSIDLNEATLVSMTPGQAATFARAYPGLRVRPEVILYPLRFGSSNLVRAPARRRPSGRPRLCLCNASIVSAAPR